MSSPSPAAIPPGIPGMARAGSGAAGGRTAGPSARQVTAIVGVLSLAVFMSSLDLFIVNLAFPYIGREYHGTSLSSLSWILERLHDRVRGGEKLVAGRAVGRSRIGRRRLVRGLEA